MFTAGAAYLWAGIQHDSMSAQSKLEYVLTRDADSIDRMNKEAKMPTTTELESLAKRMADFF